MENKRSEKSEEYEMREIRFNSPTPISNVPPWLFPKIKVDFAVMELKKGWDYSKIGQINRVDYRRL